MRGAPQAGERAIAPAALGLLDPGRGLGGRERLDADHAAVRAMVGELHPARDLRKQRVVLAAADVQTRPEPAPTLADEDGATRHEVAIVALDAQALRIAVAPVPGTALTLF